MQHTTGEIRDAYKIFVSQQGGRDQFEDLGTNFRIIFKCVLQKQGE
jgi:hypothetical protein